MCVNNIQYIVYCIMEEKVMKQTLMERLEILQSANLIDEDVFSFCEKVVNYFLEQTSEWPQENMEIFITHLAMAANRAKKGEAEGSLDDAIKEALKQEDIYDEAKRMLDSILKLTTIYFPESEVDLLLVHVCTLCKARRESLK